MEVREVSGGPKVRWTVSVELVGESKQYWRGVHGTGHLLPHFPVLECVGSLRARTYVLNLMWFGNFARQSQWGVVG
jgi:hypothetical protein